MAPILILRTRIFTPNNIYYIHWQSSSYCNFTSPRIPCMYKAYRYKLSFPTQFHHSQNCQYCLRQYAQQSSQSIYKGSFLKHSSRPYLLDRNNHAGKLKRFCAAKGECWKKELMRWSDHYLYCVAETKHNYMAIWIIISVTTVSGLLSFLLFVLYCLPFPFLVKWQ